METKEPTAGGYFSILTIIHGVMLIGQVVFLLIFYYLNSTQPDNGSDEDLNNIFQILVPLFVIAALIMSSFISSSKLKLIKENKNLKEKLAGYQTMLIIKYAILEGPSLFALICFFLTGNYLFLGLAGFIILVFVINRPTKAKAGQDLELSKSERDLLEDPNSIIR